MTVPNSGLVTASGHLVKVRDISAADIEFEATPEGGRFPLFIALLYRLRNSADDAWAVRINEIGPKNRCCHNFERWYGGWVIGLGKRLSYSAAREIAENWVVLQEMPGVAPCRSL